jgi:methylmalonyl-CoA/ethylmalonyl-CoA epimerase
MEAKFTYVGIRVRSMKKSLDFYTTFLGMKDKGQSRIEVAKGDVAYLVSEDGKVGIELNHYDSDSPFNTKYTVGEGLDHLAFGVKDLDSALREAKRKGYKFLKEMRTDKSRWVFVQDPNGIWIELFKSS